ncbi:FxSxx-COOH system tetratricopeptide repeat protein [Nocardia arthritidis]|uniref:Tetratricopeptide repeat protein n=1 Tax=Nocardia arthritidis TaxID=228602 RepID=A0A6G9YHM6_9NOCA|nr:FxSxx-COOH system tetratricopeptide repeat protein [Nocardia arthritidis]QIS12691.1 tetratricopeptide repeat protein [Nocardia arthritidis]
MRSDRDDVSFDRVCDEHVLASFAEHHRYQMQTALWHSNIELEYAGWSGHGFTDARLLTVYLTRPGFDGKAIMKYEPRKLSPEPRRHRTVWANSPAEFRDRHLVEPIGDPITLADDGSVQFQAVAFDDMSGVSTLTEAIARDRTNKQVAERLSLIVTALLHGWNPNRRAERTTVGALLRDELHDRFDIDWAVRRRLLTPDGRPTDAQVDGFANPLALVYDEFGASAANVRVRRGYAHRDLHSGNLLVTDDPRVFKLIDLIYAREHRSLAADPAYLLLTTLAGYLSELSPPAREELANLVVSPDYPDYEAEWLPPIALELVRGMYESGVNYGGTRGMLAEWRAQYQLALVAEAMILAAWEIGGETAIEWFLGVAARAAAQFGNAPTRSDNGTRVTADTPTSRSSALELPDRQPVAVSRAAPTELEGLRTAEGGAVLVLHGLPGIGKTQLAIQYAHQHLAEFTGVVWLAADRPELLPEAVAHTAARLGLLPAKDADLLRTKLFRHLSETGPWLYVLDGAPDMDTCLQFVPRLPGVHVLITSRDPRWTKIAKRCEIGPFDPAESIELLTEILGDKSGLGDLAEALEHLPAAVDQAAHFLVDSLMSLTEYANQVRDEPVRVLSTVDGTIPGSLGATWRLALEHLAETDPAAAEVIEFLAFLAAAPIPREVLTAVPASVYPRFAAEARDAFGLDPLVKRAIASGLLRIEHGSPRMYSLLSAFVRDRTAPDARARAKVAARTAVARCRTGDPRDPDSWPRFHDLVPHALEVDLAGGDADARALLLDIIGYLVARNDLDTALSLARHTHERWAVDPGPRSEPALAAISRLAQVHYHRGDYDESLRLHIEAYTLSEELYGADDPATLVAAQNAVSGRRFAKAWSPPSDLPTSAELLESHRKVLRRDHRDTLIAAHNHAAELRESGDIRAAAELDADTHARMVAELGEHHADTMASAHALGLDLRARGDHSAALTQNREVYRLRLEALGKQHPATAQSAVSLAQDLRTAGELTEARDLLRAAHAVLTETYGADDRLTLLAAHELCAVRAKLEGISPEEVEALLERRRRVLGEAHGDTMRTWALWIQTLMAAEKYTRAAQERALWRAQAKNRSS